jgi:hypothetical protein
VGSATLAGEQRDIFVRSQAAEEPSPSDIGNLELPVSQLQQQKAQKKASDELADKQKALADEQQRQAEQATADQKAELRKQRAKLQDSRSASVKPTPADSWRSSRPIRQSRLRPIHRFRRCR